MDGDHPYNSAKASEIKRQKLMIPPITKLLIKIDQLEWDLAEVKKELEKLQSPFMKSLTPEERVAARSARVRAQNERLRSLRKKRDPAAKTLTAEELQQLSLEEGINPEDNLLSSAIIEEREKRSE